MARRAIVIGAGFSGLSSAALLSKQGWDVTVLEKNHDVGGRARALRLGEYRFDMGPTWYLMPEVFSRFFGLFDRAPSDFYALRRLDPFYRAFFGSSESHDLRPDPGANQRLFDSFESKGGEKLSAYLAEAGLKYAMATREFLYREPTSLASFARPDVVAEALHLNLLGSLDRFVRKSFQDPRSRKLLQYSSVFLGTSPRQTPALYSLMTHVDLALGVRHPEGGMAAVAGAIARLALSLGVQIRTGCEVREVIVRGRRAVGVRTDAGELRGDVVLVTSDYPHAETSLLDEASRTYSARYWRRRTLAPSMFIAFLGVAKPLPRLIHHNLAFADDWDRHFDSIFRTPAWPEDPSFYMNVSARTDRGAAPAGKSNLFLLVPIAPGLPDTDELRERFLDRMLTRVEKIAGERIRGSIEQRLVYSIRDYERDFHAYRGTALGLAHTLFQTALFRPALRSRKLPNLYYAGQYTHPGIGVPMALIAAEIITAKIQKEYESWRTPQNSTSRPSSAGAAPTSRAAVSFPTT